MLISVFYKTNVHTYIYKSEAPASFDSKLSKFPRFLSSSETLMPLWIGKVWVCDIAEIGSVFMHSGEKSSFSFPTHWC